ncbi:multidrug effflux MFS transporter [Silicimonas sp. MF1-12-2]|uniref:multidrug effflux MFS transporter n=1 Tax=Silicimonas sp. MF1-12-2 TaxID=3384793 RepID=UPI0039B5F4D7
MPTDITAKEAPREPISRVELVALLAMLSATIAFSIDAMLPALPEIGQTLNPADPNRAQLIIAAFVIGMGAGTLFSGPLSDALGRRPVAVGGAIIYSLAALYGATSDSLDELLMARAVQGLGAAGPRVTAIAIVRDLFSGRQMARITSFIMIVFTLVPVVAPSLGAGIAWAFGWRAIFMAFAVFSALSMLWLLTRLPETLPHDRRRPFRLGKLAEGLAEVFSNRQVVLAIGVQTLVFGMLFSALMSSQAVFGQIYGKEETFPLWFGFMAAITASSSLLNAMVVVRFGMKRVVTLALLVLAVLTALFLLGQLALWSAGPPPFAITFLWITAVFYMAGLGIGNMNAIALEPMGHIAGMASSVVSATSTVASILLAAPVGQMFDGTAFPLTASVLGLSAGALLLVLFIRETDGGVS